RSRNLYSPAEGYLAFVSWGLLLLCLSVCSVNKGALPTRLMVGFYTDSGGKTRVSWSVLGARQQILANSA
ncbi:MAG: hypothetical protein ACYC42_08195, partial [Lysobacter sp.]